MHEASSRLRERKVERTVGRERWNLNSPLAGNKNGTKKGYTREGARKSKVPTDCSL